MRRLPIVLVFSSLTLTTILAAAEPTPRTEEDNTFYALGVIISGNLQTFGLTARELELVEAGITDGLQDKVSLTDLESYEPKLLALQKTRMAKMTQQAKAAGAAYRASAAAEQGATRTRSGIVMKTLIAGTGASPAEADQIKVHYTGRFVDGTLFDSSVARNSPATFTLTGVIPCWKEALQLMKVGGKAQIVCPSDRAYGDEGRPPQIPAGATLVFEVELLDIVKVGGPEAPGTGK